MSCPGPVSARGCPPDCTPATPVSFELQGRACSQLGRASPGLLSYARHVSKLTSNAPTTSDGPCPPPPRCEIPGSGSLGQSPTGHSSHRVRTRSPGRTTALFPRCPCGELGWAASIVGTMAWSLALVGRKVSSGLQSETACPRPWHRSQSFFTHDDGRGAGPELLRYVSTVERSPCGDDGEEAGQGDLVASGPGSCPRKLPSLAATRRQILWAGGCGMPGPRPQGVLQCVNWRGESEGELQAQAHWGTTCCYSSVF